MEYWCDLCKALTKFVFHHISGGTEVYVCSCCRIVTKEYVTK